MRGRVTLILPALGLLYALGIYWGMPSALTPASDSIAPLGPLAFVAKHSDPNISYIYPAVQQLLLSSVYAVVLGFGRLTGSVRGISAAWPYGLVDPSATFTTLILFSNLVSLVMALSLLHSMWRMRPHPLASQTFSVLLIGLSGVFAYYARVANMDMPYLGWLLLAWSLLWSYLVEPSPGRRKLLGAALCSALAVGTKDQACGAVLGFGLLLLMLAPRGQSGLRVRARQAGLFSLAFAGLYAIVAIAPQPARWLRHIQYVNYEHGNPEAPATLVGQLHVLIHCYARLHHVLTYAGLPLALAGIFILLRSGRRRELVLLLTPAASYYCLIIAVSRATEERYLLPIAIPLALCAGVAAGALLKSVRRPAFGGAVLGIVLAAQVVFSLVPVTWCQLFDTKAAMSREAVALLPPGSPILLDGMVSFNYPNRDFYERYRLMLPPGQSILPPSTHAGNVLHQYDEAARHVLSGSQAVSQPGGPAGQIKLLRRWCYPQWVKSHIHVPAVYEFYLFERPQSDPRF